MFPFDRLGVIGNTGSARAEIGGAAEECHQSSGSLTARAKRTRSAEAPHHRPQVEAELQSFCEEPRQEVTGHGTRSSRYLL